MNTEYIFPAILITNIILLNGCALVDKHLFIPAASHARVDPLFRTEECRNYKAPNGEHWLSTLLAGSTRNMSSIVFQDICDFQTRSINDVEKDPENDKLYAKLCEPLSDSNLPTASLDVNKANESQEKAAKDKATATAPQSQSLNCLNYLISKSDEICEIHKSHIYGNRTAMNTTLQVLATGTGIAGSMSGVGAAQALAGTSGFLTGSLAIMNEEVYQNIVTQAILLEINTNRANFLVDKISSYNKSTLPISIGEIRRDALDYHNKCSFYDGLTSLLNKAGDKVEKDNPAFDRLVAKKNLLVTKKAQLGDEIGKLDSAKDKTLIDQKKAELEKIENEINITDLVISTVRHTKNL